MKKLTNLFALQIIKPVFFLFFLFFIGSIANGQLATFPLRTANAVNNNTPPGQAQVSLTNPNVVTGTLISGASMLQNSYNGNGYRVKTQLGGTGVPWATAIDNNFGFDIPIKPAVGFDMNITCITFNIYQPDTDFDLGAASHFTVVPYYQVDNAGPWRPLSGSVAQIIDLNTTSVNFGTINETFYSGHNYVVRFYVYNTDGAASAKNDLFRCINLVFCGTTYQPVAQPVTVQTVSAAATGKYSASATGTYDFNANQFYQVQQSGFIWSPVSAAALAAMDTSATTKTTNGSAGVMSGPITGLSAGTTYWIRAYIVTQFGIQYGATIQFTTDAPTAPVVTTNPITNVLSNKATGGGVIVDSGGVAITSKGLVWNAGGGATIASNIGKIILNGGSDPFSDLIKQLQPNTSYCYRAFATNFLGTSYGADVCFTTGAPVPVLTAIPGQINFGTNFFGANAITVSYVLTGAYLNPANGNITITVPAGSGFEISLNSGSGFGTSLSIPYTGGALTRRPIFVRFLTSGFGIKSAVITHSGGGVSAADADIVTLNGEIVQSPDDVSNTGTDFYLGFGYEEKMSRRANDQDECRLSVYVTNPGSQAVRVHCDLTSGGYAQVVTIPAFGSHTFSGFPMGDPANNTNAGNFPDTRLYSTGVSSKSLHVYTEQNIPVAVHMHSYTRGNSAAGSIVFPTNTWNSSYTVQAFGGESNNSNPNSFFFVIAKEDNTVVTFTPTQPILDATAASLFNENQTTPANTLYPANGTYTVTLNKGQVFNAMGGFSPAGNGLDLSGTKVSTTCDKTITVFGGNGRCFIQGSAGCTSTTGSDHLIQQMFPSVAWGTKYLTAATANTAPNYFRIYFQDPTAVVKVNGTTLTAANLVSVNGTPVYYQYQSDLPLSITSDKPINVSQFMLTPGCTSNSAIDAGPEMIILSPVEQAISSVVFFSPTSGSAIIDGSGAYTSYMNVIIPSSKTASFRLDGVAPVAGSFTAHPQDAGYSYARLPVASLTKHSLTADTGFVAIAYGYGDGESYGFNAGTSIKNLSSIKISDNPLGSDSSSTVVRTCVNTPITLRIALPWSPTLVDSVVWQPKDSRITPNAEIPGAIVGGIAKVEDTITVSGRTFYVYKSPIPFTFSANGLYSFKVTAYGTFLSDCPGEDQQVILVNVGQDLLNLAANPSCGNPTVPFTADTVPMVGTNILSWEWDFGDGTVINSGTISPQTHTYPAGPTEFLVKLTTTNTVGCISTDSVRIDFGGGLESKFTISKDSVCANVPVTFTDASTASGTSGAISSWEWVFDNGNTFNGQIPPAQTWTTPGIKTISLTVRTPIGCVKEFKDTVVVEATPVAAINTNPTFVCLGQTANYQDASTIAIGNITGWTWTFDEGNPLVSTVQNPSHVWLTPGNHTVTLAVTSAGGCPSTNTATHTINVNQLPKAGFRYDMNCTSRTLTATDTSNGFGNNITGWEWDFGDGATSTVQNPVHVYATSGTYTVTLFVTTVNGCRSATAESVTITIAASPVADFTLPGNTCLPSASPAFQNTTTISDGTIAQVTYTWNFGDGTGDLTAPAVIPASPTHVFPGTGPYTVTLTAISNNGCTHTVSKSYSAIFAQPVAAISPLTEVCVSGNVAFSSAASTAAGSTVTGWTWNFGDGSPADITQNPTHTYTTGGIKTVRLTVTSAAGCVSTIDTALLTVNALPTANFTDTINCSSRSVGFSDISVANSGNITQWNWNFGGTEGTSTQQNPTHVFAAEGNHTITLSVTTDKGCASNPVASQTITINPRPVADFTLPGNVCLPNASATFTNTSTISGNTPMTYQWSFGDGGTSAATNPAHIYSAVGPFTVTLTATSNNGCVQSINKQYNAIFEQPVAAITAPTGVCLGNAASFSSSTSTAPASTVNGWAWNFGDAPVPGSSTDQNPTYTYTGSGPRTVTLTVTSAAGCSSAPTTVNFNVNLSPVAGFTYSAIRCEDSTITFNDASTLNGAAITEWNWNFGDGGTLTQTTLAPATHAFTNSQSYPVSLSVKNANGCVSAAPFSLPVVINPNPVMDFTVSDICVGTGLANFTQNVTLNSGQVAVWNWDFGVAGSSPGSTANPSFTYTTGGEYNVTLTATSDSGCVNAIPKMVKAFSAPTVAFDINNAASLCSNLPVGIIDRSAVTGYGTVDKLEIYWDFQGAPAVKQTINAPASNSTYTNSYPEFGTPATKPFRVLIRAFNGPGCSTDLIQDISVLAAPQVQFTQPAPVCQEASAFILTGASDVFGLAGTGEYSGDGVSNGEFTPILAGTGPRTIRYTYTTTNGCVDFEEKDIVVNPTPTISFGNQNAINILEGDVLKLNPTITNGASYLWTPSTYLNSATSASPSGTPLDDIIYSLQVTSDKGCVRTQSVVVKVVRKYIIPNTFTPNSDGNHDFWDIENLEFYPDVRVRVFSRSGQLVFESYGYNKPWDGKFKGQDCPFGTYYYVIETGGGRGPRTGYVTIIR
ncbi:MAG TPA: PKD domain-containing protein [Ferruginibacter sp.]|nr:PKD domain-containing protein [Ferruginibacter sp.]